LADESLLETQILEAHRKRATRQIEWHASHGGCTMPPIHFEYANHPFVNASAFFMPYNRQGYIAVNTGLVLLVYDLFYRMLSHPEILPESGDATAESVRDPFHTEGIFDDYNKLRASRPKMERLADTLPRNSQRRKLADSLATLAIDFIIFHEIAHIRFGHCEFVDSSTRTFMIEELAATNNTTAIDPMTVQFFEWHADGFASNATYTTYVADSSQEIQGARRRIQTRGFSLPGYEFLISDWAFAIGSLFWLFGLNFEI
jgi:hypothetical protein